MKSCKKNFIFCTAKCAVWPASYDRRLTVLFYPRTPFCIYPVPSCWTVSLLFCKDCLTNILSFLTVEILGRPGRGAHAYDPVVWILLISLRRNILLLFYCLFFIQFSCYSFFLTYFVQNISRRWFCHTWCFLPWFDSICRHFFLKINSIYLHRFLSLCRIVILYI